jgi:RNA polymerase sigma factor (sigma-70 family)
MEQVVAAYRENVGVSGVPDRKVRQVFRNWVSIAERAGRKVGLTVEEAQDCAMELITRLITQKYLVPSYRWLYRCARNAAINYRVQRERQSKILATPAMLPESRLSTPLDTLIEQERVEYLLSKLDQEPRRIFCCCLEGYSVAEIAELVGKTPNAVRLVLTRCRRKLRKVLAAEKKSEKNPSPPT